VTEAMKRGSCPTVVPRPATLYGPGAEIYTGITSLSFAHRIFVVFGDGSNELPLVHVDNAVDAIGECITNGAADNEMSS